MALREGLSPVGNEVLQAELRAAALRRSGSPDGGGSSAGEQAAPEAGRSRPQDVQQLALLAAPAFSSAVQQTAALGLSPEGMSLFQQQAAALEAVVGVSRARSLTEVIGRAKVQTSQQLYSMAEADAAVSAAARGAAPVSGCAAARVAWAGSTARPLPLCAQARILEVLLTVPEREDRAAMLPDAFTPLGSSAGARPPGLCWLGPARQLRPALRCTGCTHAVCHQPSPTFMPHPCARQPWTTTPRTSHPTRTKCSPPRCACCKPSTSIWRGCRAAAARQTGTAPRSWAAGCT